MPRQTLIGFIVALLTVVAMSAVTYRVLQTRSAGVQTVMQSLEMTRSLEEAISTLKDAETGHRGYLLLGAEPYLGPYTAALDELPRNIEDIRRLAADSPAQLQRLDAVQHLAADRMALLR